MSPSTFVHIVFFRLRDRSPGGQSKAEVAAELKRRFEALVGVIPGLTRCEVGLDILGGDEASDLALHTEFESRAAFDAYPPHPAHQAIVGLLKEMKTERRAVDFER